MEKEANTVSKSLQSLPLPDCQGEERGEPRICTGGSLKAQTKKKKGRFVSSDHGCSTSHLQPLSQAAEDLLVTVPGSNQHTGGNKAPGSRISAKQAVRRGREHCQNLPDAECHRQDRLPARPVHLV